MNYNGGTLIQKLYARMAIKGEGTNIATVKIEAGDKQLEIPVSVTGVELTGALNSPPTGVWNQTTLAWRMAPSA